MSVMKKDVHLTEERCERCPEGNLQFLYKVSYIWVKGDRIEMENERACVLGPLLERRDVKTRTKGEVLLCPHCDGPAVRFATLRRT